jgi:hypothetical protein
MVTKEELLEWMGTPLTPRVAERLRRLASFPRLSLAALLPKL